MSETSSALSQVKAHAEMGFRCQRIRYARQTTLVAEVESFIAQYAIVPRFALLVLALWAIATHWPMRSMLSRICLCGVQRRVAARHEYSNCLSFFAHGPGA